MSATQDKSQKIAFVYSNLYHLYKKGKEAAKAATSVGKPGSGAVLKAEDLKAASFGVPSSTPKVGAFVPVSLLNSRRPAVEPMATPVVPPLVQTSTHAPISAAPNEAIRELKNNLKSLNELHSKLRFMLQELEEIVKS